MLDVISTKVMLFFLSIYCLVTQELKLLHMPHGYSFLLHALRANRKIFIIAYNYGVD